jgi:hypothetical protein
MPETIVAPSSELALIEDSPSEVPSDVPSYTPSVINFWNPGFRQNTMPETIVAPSSELALIEDSPSEVPSDVPSYTPSGNVPMYKLDRDIMKSIMAMSVAAITAIVF